MRHSHDIQPDYQHAVALTYEGKPEGKNDDGRDCKFSKLSVNRNLDTKTKQAG